MCFVSVPSNHFCYIRAEDRIPVVYETVFIERDIVLYLCRQTLLSHSNFSIFLSFSGFPQQHPNLVCSSSTTHTQVCVWITSNCLTFVMNEVATHTISEDLLLQHVELLLIGSMQDK